MKDRLVADVLEDLRKLYAPVRAKRGKPLTDDQKAAMLQDCENAIELSDEQQLLLKIQHNL